MKYYERLKNIREDLDLTQTKVAKYLGTTQQQIHRYENGEQDMTVTRFKEICELYKVSADYILEIKKPYKSE